MFLFHVFFYNNTCVHTHTHTHTLTHTHSHSIKYNIHMYTLTLTHSLTLILTLSLTHTQFGETPVAKAKGLDHPKMEALLRQHGGH